MDLILPVRYLIAKDAEVGIFPVLGYNLDGKTHTKILVGSDHNLGVALVTHVGENYAFSVNHVFVGRVIDKVLKLRQEDVEIGLFYLVRGEYKTLPSDNLGELVSNYVDPQGFDVWLSYAHISGPYLIDAQYIASMITAQRLLEIALDSPIDLVPDRRIYLLNPQELPILGVVHGDTDVEVDSKYLSDLVIRGRGPKKVWVN